MADFRAIATVCESVMQLLRMNHRPADFDHELEFRVYLARNFSQPMAAGVSLLLYRIFPNGNHRIPAGRVAPSGRRYRHDLPVDMHFLLTAWGTDPSLQHTIAGWMMRTLEDTPILPSALLNSVTPGAFRPDENVEIGLTELSTEDLLRLWADLVPNTYHVSVPYLARMVKIESRELEGAGEPVQVRDFDYRRVGAPS
jgi:hypothetical protein